jgi:hypothetical protein
MVTHLGKLIQHVKTKRPPRKNLVYFGGNNVNGAKNICQRRGGKIYFLSG